MNNQQRAWTNPLMARLSSTNVICLSIFFSQGPTQDGTGRTWSEKVLLPISQLSCKRCHPNSPGYGGPSWLLIFLSLVSVGSVGRAAVCLIQHVKDRVSGGLSLEQTYVPILEHVSWFTAHLLSAPL